MFVLIGVDTKKHIVTLYNRLSTISNMQNIIWCHKNKDTAMDNLKKKQKIDDADDVLLKWIKINSPDYISYNESSKILGRTCDMLVLQDFESLTPNIMASCIETVRVVVLLYY